MELQHLYPLIVPCNYVSDTTWDLAHHPLPHKNFILTWVSFEADEAMTYLMRAEYQNLEATETKQSRSLLDYTWFLFGGALVILFFRYKR